MGPEMLTDEELEQQQRLRPGIAPFQATGLQAGLALPAVGSATLSTQRDPSLDDTRIPEQGPQMKMKAKPAVTATQPRGTAQGDQDYRSSLLNNPAGVTQIQKNVEGSSFGQRHPVMGKILGGVAQFGGALGESLIPPGISKGLPFTQIGHNVQLGQANQAVTQDEANAEKEAQTQNIQSEIPVHEAERLKQEADVAAKTPIEITEEQATAMGSPELSGVKVPSAVFAALSKQHGINSTKENTTGEVVQGRRDVASTNADSRESLAAQGIKSRESLADAANKTRMLIASMHDQTSRANNENTASHKGAPAAGKVPADVTKRASLANNVRENADAVDQLLTRNPQIVGAAGGRYSNIQDMIGSDDPDIAELGVRMHNLALASNGAHGIRSAEAIKQTEDELFKNFKRGPNGIHSALNATRGSMQTFLDDEKNFQGTGTRTGGATTPTNSTNAQPQGSSGLGVSLKDAMALPQNKGKSEADVRKDIEAHGHKVI